MFVFKTFFNGNLFDSIVIILTKVSMLLLMHFQKFDSLQLKLILKSTAIFILFLALVMYY